MKYFKQLNVFLFAFAALASSTIALAEPAKMPSRIQLTYAVTKDGQPFATVKEQFSITGSKYTVESVTKGLGVYALFGERKLTSQGTVSEQGLKPSHFELHQGDNAKKSLINDFDWASNTLNMMVKGKPKTAVLKPGTQDLASYGYQFMYLAAVAPLKTAVTLLVSTGKKLDTYTYNIADALDTLTITTESGAQTNYETLHLTENNGAGNGSTGKAGEAAKGAEEKALWLSTKHYYLPVRILFKDENGVSLEQTLTSLQIE